MNKCFIGMLSLAERRKKILEFWYKKRKFSQIGHSVKYTKKKKIADKRLRINGKFVSEK